MVKMVKKNFFKRQDEEFKKQKKTREPKKEKLTPEELKAQKKAQRILSLKKKSANNYKI